MLLPNFHSSIRGLIGVNWKYKALLQFVFSNAPFGAHVNYLFQRYVTKVLPNSDVKFIDIVAKAKNHIEFFRCYCVPEIADATFYEFGVGVTLTIPLTFYALGVDHQVIVDIRPLIRPKLVNDVVDKFQRLAPELRILRMPGKYIDEQDGCIGSLKEYYGIEYRAPYDARSSGLDSGSISCITSTDTLEHIPRKDIQAILQECYRLLRNDGLMSFYVNYQDHYARVDSSISVYNFLRYSDEVWAFFNPSLHYQNRLRHPDYLELFRTAGFEVVKEQRTDGTAGDLKTIEHIPLNDRFKKYDLEELAVRDSFFVLRKRNNRDASV